ncbi:hypothetical protein CSV86_014650 [Pseudomonas putida CSV86]|uniref:DRBM domain-containing protein n=1 Tax=Pseudomonas bharatica CSV86 TaxID=1005395 RepID=L1M407_9PSED|nr:hypothetical protein [Pseudomonas bharatica]NNJ15555.1 hypothetical protein [Pseudomonas bharatica CSV86]NNJ16366.1 hypothetical protein [Pseudomonas bharatica CSV86]
MNERYAAKKVITASVQGNSGGQNTGTSSTFHWEVQERSTGHKVEGPFVGQAEAENACLRLNYPRP